MPQPESGISVVIPCYNQGVFLKDAIDSFRNSNSPLFEIIIVNDGSTDPDTNSIIDQFALKYKVIKQENQGLARARNNGIREAAYPYILPLDADNKIELAYLEEAIKILDSEQSVGVVYANAIFFGDVNAKKQVRDFDLIELLTFNYIDACAIFRKNVWEEVGGYDANMPFMGYEDWEFWISISKTEWEFRHINDYLFHYRVSSGSMVSQCNIPDNRRKILEYIVIKHKDLYAKYFIDIIPSIHRHLADEASHRGMLEKNYKIIEKEKNNKHSELLNLQTLNKNLIIHIDELRNHNVELGLKIIYYEKLFLLKVKKIFSRIAGTIRNKFLKKVFSKKNYRLFLYSSLDKARAILGKSRKNGFHLHIQESITPYESWLQRNIWNSKSLHHLQERLNECNSIKISVVMPVYNTPIIFLDMAIQSVLNQAYKNWELCIADDCSPDPKVKERLMFWSSQDDRIRVIFREVNGNISLSTNSASALATGEFIVFLDHDDELSPDALGEIAISINNHPNADFIYSDDDKIDETGKRYDPQFKPDWSPELLLSYMYLGHLCVVRRTIFERLGGIRKGFEGSQDYDFSLRATEISREIVHIPQILYHWRAISGSIALSANEKPNSFKAGEIALQEALERRGIKAKVIQPNWALKSALGIYTHRFSDEGPTVSIIIATKNNLSFLKRCIDSIKSTTYKNYQITIIDNESDEEETIQYLRNSPHKVIKISNEGKKFNFASINNQAAETVESEYILFLNNDTEVISPQWLSQMVGYAQISGVGAVGARLLYPDKKVQHAGIIHGLHQGLAGHAFKLSADSDYGYLCYSKVLKNYSGVTAACLLTPKILFKELGGFDEQNLAVAYNDVDYCYKLIENNYRCVYCAEAKLFHMEGKSRGFLDNPNEPAYFRSKYSSKIDKFYSPHLSLENESFQIQPRKYLEKPLIKKIRILFCTHALDLTGGPLHQYEIAVEMTQRNLFDISVFSIADGPLKQDYEKMGIPVTVLNYHPLSGVNDITSYKRVLHELKFKISSLNPDEIYANTLEMFFMVDYAGTFKIPCIWNIHESSPWQTYFSHFPKDIEKIALDCFSVPYKNIFVSNSSKEVFSQLNTHHNFTVIHNGLNLKRFQDSISKENKLESRKTLKINQEDIMLLLLGTVCERKGQQDLPMALHELPPTITDKIRIFIVGDRPGSYSLELKKIIAGLPENIKERITLVKETKEVELYYLAADIFVFTSRIESFPRVIQEAMAFHLPIITTPVFGIKEQVQLNNNGLFYNPGDYKTLASKIELLVTDTNLRNHFSDNSFHVLKGLTSFDEMINRYSQIFQEAYISL
ncbi:MAG TPA: glycosyltransferase [Cytophagaceae bacterium]|jgi:glycosyltransferase involved in cell wall biosynthesis|nr:glycosyltransferase [Cytophagaceae bacterium]